MMQRRDDACMTYVLIIVLLAAVGPLALRYGVDSRLDEPRR